MNNKIIELEKYKTSIQNKKDLDDGIINPDDLSIEELDEVSKLYREEIKYLVEDTKKRLANIERLKEEKRRLKKQIERSGNN